MAGLVKFPRGTSKEEISAVLEKRGALGAERIIDFNMFLTDAFEGGGGIGFLEGPGVPTTIDGFDNDDSYRQSRHLLANASVTSRAVNEDNLRENSLARQLNSKKDQPATIRLIRRKGPEEMPAKDSTEARVPWVNLIPPNTKFFLEQVQENREEKVQVIDTFGEWVAFFFGRRPEVYSYAGTLLNSQNHDWKNEFQENYDHFLRGSQAVKNRATIVMQYDDVVVEGYMMNSTITQTSMADNSVPFQFNLLVIDRSPINPRRMLGLRFQRGSRSLAEQQLFNTLQDTLNIGDDGDIGDLETFLLMREYFSGNYNPSAGTMTHRTNTNNIESSASVIPGQNTGLNNQALSPSSFLSPTSKSIEESGVTVAQRATGGEVREL
jgi:hypothetical protein